MNRVLVLGLDGLDFDFFQRHRGSFPALDRLVSRGMCGELRSTVPPATAAAWTTALSGMNPARTGITDFGDETDGIVDSTQVRVARIWDAVAAEGGRSAVIGVPVTHPVVELDGLMVSGFLSPSDSEGRVYPPELRDHLPEGYRFSISESDYGSDRDALLNTIYASTDAKFDFLNKVLSNEVPGAEQTLNLVCFVLSEIDWIQHYFRTNPEESGCEQGEEVVREFLSHVDSRVETVLDLATDRTICMLSDHGFGKYTQKHVHINEWLRQEGHLVLETSGSTRSARQLLGRYLREIAGLPGVRYLKGRLPRKAKQRALALTQISDSNIDWNQTSAVFRQKFYNTGYIRLNRNVVDEQKRPALTSQIVSGLRGLRDPETGTPVLEEVHRREEYYAGPLIDQIPDIVFIFEPEYSGNELTGGEIVKQIPKGTRPSPAHKMGGIYSVSSPKIKASERKDTTIDCVGATLYQVLGIPFPEEIDEDVLIESVDGEYPKEGRRSYPRLTEFVNGAEGEGDVVERLEDLGYL